MQKYAKKFAASLLVGGLAALVPTAGHAFTSITLNSETGFFGDDRRRSDVDVYRSSER